MIDFSFGSPKLSEHVTSQTNSIKVSRRSSIGNGTIDDEPANQLGLDIQIIDGNGSINKDDDNGNSDVTIASDRMSLVDILKLFDLAVIEIRTLMRTDSLTRFTKTSQYHNFYKQFANSIVSERTNKGNKELTPKRSKISISMHKSASFHE